MHLGSQRPITFIFWIAFSIVVHFALTCTLMHPIDKNAQVIDSPNHPHSVEVYLTAGDLHASSTIQPCDEHCIVTENAPISIPEWDEPPPPPTALSNENRSPSDASVFSSSVPDIPDESIDELCPESSANGAQITQAAQAAINNPAPKYPAKARAAGQAGSVGLRIFLDQKGIVQKIDIIQTSGYILLDQQAYDTILKKWRFIPAYMDDQPVDATLDIQIHFRLKD